MVKMVVVVAKEGMCADGLPCRPRDDGILSSQSTAVLFANGALCTLELRWWVVGKAHTILLKIGSLSSR